MTMQDTTAVMRFSLKEDDENDQVQDVNSSISSTEEVQNKSSLINDDLDEQRHNKSYLMSEFREGKKIINEMADYSFILQQQ